MEPIRTVRGRILPIPRENIDTDQITPARFLRTMSRDHLANVLFHDWRFREDGSPKPDFPMNKPEHRGATIILAGDNFGCGSSREHAAWAILAAGFRAIVSTSFGDIFRNNAARNGLLTVAVPPDIHRSLFDLVRADPRAEIEISLEHLRLTFPDGRTAAFSYDPFARMCLLEGKDALDLLLERSADIERYERSHPPPLTTKPS